MRIREIGVARAWVKGDCVPYNFHPSCHEALLTAWKTREPFFDGIDLYGAKLSIRLADVTALGLAEPEHVQLAREDEDEDRREEAFT